MQISSSIHNSRRSIKQTAARRLGSVSSQNKISDQNTYASDRKYIYHILLYVVVIPVKVIEEQWLVCLNKGFSLNKIQELMKLHLINTNPKCLLVTTRNIRSNFNYV